MNSDMKLRYQKYINPILWEHIEHSRMAKVSLMGTISELEARRYIKEYLGEDWELVHNKDGSADFTAVNKVTDQLVKIEAKRTSKNVINFQRAIRDITQVRLYDYDFCDIICVDMSDFTGVLNDYRFINTQVLPSHKTYSNKIKPSIVVEEYSTTLNDAIKKLKK